jgi:hypothetical protein
LSIFPALMDRDFMYPALLLKVTGFTGRFCPTVLVSDSFIVAPPAQFYSFMAAGFSWNRASLLDMLGDPAGPDFNASIVREVMYLLLFPAKVDVPQTAFKAALDLITGTAYAAEFSSGGAPSHTFAPTPQTTPRHIERTSSDTSLNGTGDFSGLQSPTPEPATLPIARHDFAKAEKLLWSMLTAHDELSTTATPSKAEAAACLRVYRRLLQTAHWKPDSLSSKQTTRSGLLHFMSAATGANFSGDIDESQDAGQGGGSDALQSIVLEVEEVFCTLNLLSALCKALVLAHKTREKKLGPALFAGLNGANDTSTVSLEELFESVSVGTKSDFANSILECLSNCAYLWRRRYEPSLLATFKSANLLLQKPTNASPDSTAGTVSHPGGISGRPRTLVAHTLKEANRRFLLQDSPVIPASAVFRLVTKNIPLPKSVHEFIHLLFANRVTRI